MGVGKFFLRGFLNFPYLKYGVVYYETIQRELNRRLKYECRCDGSSKVKTGESTRPSYTGLCGGLEHLKIETRLWLKDCNLYIMKR